MQNASATLFHSSVNSACVSGLARVSAPDEPSPMVPSFIITQPLSATVLSVCFTSPVVHDVSGMSKLVHFIGGPMVPTVAQALLVGLRSLTEPVPLSNHTMLAYMIGCSLAP